MTMTTLLRATAAVLAMTAVQQAMAATPQPGEKLAADQTYTYRLLDEFPTLDPQMTEEVEGSAVERQLFEGLVNEDAAGKLIPGTATSWEVSADKTVYTFHLRPEAKWSNGDPVTAGDFVYAWRRLADPKTASPYGWFIEMSKIANAGKIVAGEAAPDTLGVVATDDHTLTVTLSQPVPYFTAMLINAAFYPDPQATVEKFGAEWTRPGNMVTNGAYTLAEHVPNEYFTLKKSDTYWDAKDTVITQVKGLIINDENQALTRYMAGELDWTDIPAGQYPDLKAKYPDQATSVPQLCSYYYAINFADSGNPALKDVRVREALSYALDRQVIVNAVLKGGQYPAYNFTHVKTAEFKLPEIDYAGWSQKERDEKAVQLMKEAGYGKDHPLDLKFIYNTSESHKAIATVAAQMWKQKLGVNITMENYEWQTYLQVRKQGKFDLARSAWCGDYNEPSTFLDILTTGNEQNDGKYTDAKYDAAMAASKTADDPEADYTEAEKVLADDMGIIPIYHYTSVFMLKPEVKGWPYDNVEKTRYAKDLYKIAE